MLEYIMIIITFITMILVGTPIKYNCFEINIIINIIAGIYYIYCFKKKKIVITKIDVLMFVFCLTPIIPVIFKTYGSLEQSLMYIIKNISLFNIYSISKIINTNKLIKTILIASICIFLLGIDELTTRLLFEHIEKIGLPIVKYDNNRISSIFGYQNAYAVLMGIAILFSINKTKNEIYSGLFFLFLSGLLLSYSRMVLVFWCVCYIIYIITSKNKMYYIGVTFINILLSLFYMKIFVKFHENEQYIILWICTFILFFISILFTNIFKKNFNVLKNIKKSTYIKIGMIGILLMIIFLIVGIFFTKPLLIFQKGKTNKQVKYSYYEIEPNTQYTIKFDMEAMSNSDIIEGYSIQIDEENKLYDIEKTHEIKFNNFIGEKIIEFTTTENTESFTIYFKSKEKIIQNGLIIKCMTINEKKYALDYVYLPVNIVERIRTFWDDNKSLTERLEFYKTSIKIIRNNLFSGTGGNGWEYNYKDYQTYNYSTTESHSYFLKLMIENGILAGILWCIIILILIKTLYNKFRKKCMTTIDFAILLLTVHSFLDFDLSFYSLNYIWMILFAKVIFKTEDKISLVIRKKLYIYCALAIFVFGITFYVGINYYKVKQENKEYEQLLGKYQKTENTKQIMDSLKKLYSNEKYIIFKKFYLMNLDYKNMTTDELEYIYLIVKNKNVNFNIRNDLDLYRLIMQIIQESEDKRMVEKFKELAIDKGNKIKEYINNIKGNRLSEEDVKMYMEEYYEISSRLY